MASSPRCRVDEAVREQGARHLGSADGILAGEQPGERVRVESQELAMPRVPCRHRAHVGSRAGSAPRSGMRRIGAPRGREPFDAGGKRGDHPGIPGACGPELARLAPPAREIVERVHLPILAESGFRDGRAVIDRLHGPECTLDLRARSKDAAVLAAVAKIVGTLRGPERALYREHLLHGGPGDRTRGTGGGQRAFAEVLTGTLDESDWELSPESMATLAGRARELGASGEELARRLEHIRTCELLIAPAVAFFDFALECDGQAPGDIALKVHPHWGTVPSTTLDLAATAALEQDLRTWPDDSEAGKRWINLAHAFHGARYEDALQIVLEQNAAIMKARSAAAPWAVIREGKLHVRFRDEQPSHLPDAAELPR
jgi:hypothetical protein